MAGSPRNAASIAAATVPLALIHPRVLNQAGSDLPDEMRVAFYTSLLGMALLFMTLYRFEMATKHTRAQLKAIRRQLGEHAASGGRSAAPRITAS